MSVVRTSDGWPGSPQPPSGLALSEMNATSSGTSDG